LKTKPQVSSDRLTSYSKLQFCLELCQFIQVLLKPGLQDGKRISV
jgi:hypothetical protein